MFLTYENEKTNQKGISEPEQAIARVQGEIARKEGTMSSIVGPIPDHILMLMRPEDRPKGVAGLTAEELRDQADKQREKMLQANCIAILDHRGIIAQWSRMDKPTTGRVGWPDLTFAVPRRGDYGVPCAVEVKVGRAQPTEEQVAVLDRLRFNGWCVRVLRSEQELVDLLNELTTEKRRCNGPAGEGTYDDH